MHPGQRWDRTGPTLLFQPVPNVTFATTFRDYKTLLKVRQVREDETVGVIGPEPGQEAVPWGHSAGHAIVLEPEAE